MAIIDIGALGDADEHLNHQIVDTFATVAESDYSWTEKIWVSVSKSDGSLSADFGIGKYKNRGVIDGFAGISRGREQWTVRASRELRSAPDDTRIGPIVYEVVEPRRSIRIRLEPNDVQPISFDLVLTGATPPFFEDRNVLRNPISGRVDMNVVRYHQAGWATGTITVDGRTVTIGEEEGFGVRDHSWGVRTGIGQSPSDLIEESGGAGENGASHRRIVIWNPNFLRRPDGSTYETHVYLTPGWGWNSSYVNDADGTQTRVHTVRPRLQFDPRTRYLRGGVLGLVMQSGEEREIEVEVLGDSGFYLKTTGYGLWKGHRHGSWSGPLHLDGEYLNDCWDDEHLALLGPLRNTPVRVREGDAVGYGIIQAIVVGEWPELGLTSDSDRGTVYSAS